MEFLSLEQVILFVNKDIVNDCLKVMYCENLMGKY